MSDTNIWYYLKQTLMHSVLHTVKNIAKTRH